MSYVIQILKEVIEVVIQAEKNDLRYRRLRAKLDGALETLETRSRHNSSNPFGKRNTENLINSLKKIHTFLEKSKKSKGRFHQIRHTLLRIINAKQNADEIKELEDELDSALIAITAFMTAQRTTRCSIL
ncbi:10247_t:CDS:2 [Ambispora leptoticha]|uniref:10247_t:CDS:1 n=1 Tax=Ambispora leptoticha TaxID=144679 RepID=A0A9N9DWQ7_9GLOM|nr:10247_t:CDS:2 [Ambispora leptoticha]